MCTMKLHLFNNLDPSIIVAILSKFILSNSTTPLPILLGPTLTVQWIILAAIVTISCIDYRTRVLPCILLQSKVT